MCKQVEHGDMSSNHKKNKYKNMIRMSRYRKCCVQMTVLCANDTVSMR